MDEWGLHKVKVFRDESGHTRLFLDGNDISKRCFGFRLEQVGDDATTLTLQVQCRAEIELDAAVVEEDPPAWADGCDWTLYGSKKEESYRNRIKAGNDWIPVTERLPEQNTRVIGFMAWKGITAIEYQHGKWYSIDHLQSLPDEAVTHWMPLPEPPKESETNG